MRAACIAAALSVAHGAHAENLGAKADTYRLDRDAREQLKDVVRAKERSGELAKFWQQYRDKTVDSIKHPQPLGVKSEYSSRSELRELKFLIPQDYRNEKGQIVVRKGTLVEPLRIKPLTHGLIFIDGRDTKQVEYAIRESGIRPLKIVLTAGSAYDLRVKYKDVMWQGFKGVPFYFDQRKMIINQLRQLYGIEIASVPAQLYQKENRLQVAFGLHTP